MTEQDLISCEEFVARLQAVLATMCEDWRETHARDPEECPELMRTRDWWSHLATLFPE